MPNGRSWKLLDKIACNEEPTTQLPLVAANVCGAGWSLALEVAAPPPAQSAAQLAALLSADLASRGMQDRQSVSHHGLARNETREKIWMGTKMDAECRSTMHGHACLVGDH